MAESNGAEGPPPAWSRRPAGAHDRALIAAIAHVGAAVRHLHLAGRFGAAALAAARIIEALAPLLDALMLPAIARGLVDRAQFDREHGTDYARRDFGETDPEDDDADPEDDDADA